MTRGSASGRRRVTVAGRRLTLSSLDKLMYPEAGTTKADVQEYLQSVAGVMVPHLLRRPVTRKRWPDGVGTEAEPQQAFFRKALEPSAPSWVPRVEQEHEDHTTVYPLVDDEAVLAWFGQVAALELHVPQWRFDDDGAPQNPDRMVLDLDPGEGVGLADCAQVARWCAELLEGMDMPSVPVTTGSKGIHLYAGLDGASTSEEVSAVAHELAGALEQDHPDQVLSRMDRSARRGKVFIDWSQNSRSKTSIAPYSLRGRTRPTVAAPRTWEELRDPALRHLEHDEVMARLADGVDPLAELPGGGGRDGGGDGPPLHEYRRRRSPGSTPEPFGQREGPPEGAGGRPLFVVQEHHARRLHYDTRLEHEGVLVSWAVPKGPSTRQGATRLAVRTEDHPLGYATFEGRIPDGQHGAGEVTIWDTGTAEIERWRRDEVIAVLHGQEDGGLGGRPRRYVLVRTQEADQRSQAAGAGEQWLMRLTKDQPRQSGSPRKPARPGASSGPGDSPDAPGSSAGAAATTLPTRLPGPMLATPGAASEVTGEAWRHEAKWDGWRALAGVGAEGLVLRSRGGEDLSGRFPELEALTDLVPPGTLVDGEIIALDGQGRPDFGLLQQRAGLIADRRSRRARHRIPVCLMVFDVLHTAEDGDVTRQPWRDRRDLLEELLSPVRDAGLGTVDSGSTVLLPPVLGGSIQDALERSRTLGLEGVVAKRADAPYRAGRRSRAWVKVTHAQHQDVVLIGWRAGAGSRARTLGSLLTAVVDDGALHYAGRVGTGLSEAELESLRSRLERIERKTPPAGDVPRGDRREVRWVTPKLVGEVRHSGRTREGRLRQPVWRGLRSDKSPDDVRWE